jgi:O-antigen ligase
MRKIISCLHPSKISLPYLIAIAAAFSALLPFCLGSDVPFHDSQRIIEVFCAALSAVVVATCLLRNVGFKQVGSAFPIYLLSLFFLLGLGSSILAYSSRHAFFEWANFLLLFTMSYLVAGEIVVKGEALLDQMLRLCGLGCAFYILVEIIIYGIVLAVGSQPPNEALIYGFDNYRFFNHIQTITLPLLGLLVCRSDGGKQKIMAWIATSIWWTLLFVATGRGTFIGLLAGACFAFVCLGKNALPWCRVMLVSALAGLGIYLLFYVLIPMAVGLQPFGFLFHIVERTAASPDSGRRLLWERAWEMTLAHPWLGAGPLHFAHYGRDVQILGFQSGAHPHNWVMQIVSEWGIPALLCLMTAIALALKKLLAVRQYLSPTDSKNHLTLAALLTTGVAILVDGLVSGLIVMPTSQLWIALYIGCAWGWAVSMTPVPVAATVSLSMPVRLCGAAVMLALLYCLGNGLWPEIRHLPLHEEQNLQKDIYVNPILHPRIWAGGYF